jgi:hypothetical protein
MRLRVALFVLFTAAAAHADAADDKTLPPADYAARGVPAIDKPWTADDYNTAATVIFSLPAAELPRLGTRSAPMVDRLGDPEAAKLCLGDDDLRARSKRCGTLLIALGRLLTCYGQNLTADPRLGDSAMRIVEGTMLATDEAAKLVPQMKATLDPEAPDYPLRLSGLDMIKASLLRVFGGAGQMMGQREVYSDSERLRLALIVAKLFPDLAGSVTREAYAALRMQYRTIANTETNSAIKAALESTQDAPPPI